ncbi:hypothetical protein BDF20DRAFT_826842 [Mycotypha africana]|uniref:uncharacterized protein n=1 Tax=Mycotypha africana TaxID=64632 RepID=UPI0022FFD698|nr:uncharacterized protein BDF20DRAFT_826842 [Mycotypha africana]KAI8969233.1 hypothetical protein BDF20DRAFT_826842 [Mycotypha africana]
MFLYGSSTAKDGWLLVLASSCACIAGASLIFLKRRILENKHFISASLSLGGGVLLFNSLYILLPASHQNLNSNLLTFACFFIGVFLTISLSYIVEWSTPNAIHTSTNIATIHNHDVEYGTVVVGDASHVDHKKDFLSIGIQTAIAICIHKFPGYQLGLKVTAAMTIHNFVEGFLISLPLFHAINSRSAAFIYASLLGGLSQPLGAVLGLLTITELDQIYNKYLFGITFGVVSGMLCFIAIQSMLPQAVKLDHHNQRNVTLFFFIGISLIGFSNIIQSL